MQKLIAWLKRLSPRQRRLEALERELTDVIDTIKRLQDASSVAWSKVNAPTLTPWGQFGEFDAAEGRIAAITSMVRINQAAIFDLQMEAIAIATEIKYLRTL